MDGIPYIEESFQTSNDKKASVSANGMVSTAFPDATAAGVLILRRGGNAVDAACAAAMALCVCEPQASGLGGQSIALIHVDGRTTTIDGSSRAPSKARASLFESASRRHLGYKATTVPSTVAMLGYMHEKYGTLDWQTVLAPAIRIARRGYRITALQHYLQKQNLKKFMSVKSRSGARYFLKDGEIPYDEGDTFVQEDLANTLEQISSSGYKTFYHGAIATIIDQDMRKNGGLLRREDLGLVPVPVERKPVHRTYRGLDVYTTPPPSAGTTMLLVLMILDNIPSVHLSTKGHDVYHYVAETFRKSLLYHTQRPFEPKTYRQVSDRIHLSQDFAKQMALSIGNNIDTALPVGTFPDDSGDTTHLSVMDSQGNAVSLTQSIELVYGSKAAAENLGFLYNNYISAFEYSKINHPFFLRPNSYPWSSVCPCIVFYRDKPWLTVGSPGSSRIFSTMSLFLSRLLDERNSLYTAMMSPRMHCSLGGTVSLEQEDSTMRLAAYLEKMGYTIDMRERYSFYLGAIHAVLRRSDGDGFQGVAEMRRDGTAGGP